MASFSVDDIFEIEVDVQRNGSYPETIAGIAVPLVKGEKGASKAFDFRLFVHDPNDIGVYSARLAADGMSIRLTVPSLPSFFYRDAEAMFDLEEEDTEVFFSEAKTMTEAFATKIRKNVALQTRSIQLNLSMKCRVFDDRFGSSDGQSNFHGHELTPHVYVLPSSFENVEWNPIYLFYRIQIDNSFEETSTPLQKNARDTLLKQFDRLNLSGKKTTDKVKERKSDPGFPKLDAESRKAYAGSQKMTAGSRKRDAEAQKSESESDLNNEGNADSSIDEEIMNTD